MWERRGVEPGGEERRVSLMRSLINVWLTGVTLMPPTHNPPPHTSLRISQKNMANIILRLFCAFRGGCCCFLFVFFPSGNRWCTWYHGDNKMSPSDRLSQFSRGSLWAHVLSDDSPVSSHMHPPNVQRVNDSFLPPFLLSSVCLN